MSDHEKVQLHFVNGETLEAFVPHDLLDEGGHENVEDYVNHQITNPAMPHWATVGDVTLFTQTLCAWTVA